MRVRNSAPRVFFVSAVCVALLGTVFSLLTGTWRQGGLGLSLGAAVVLLGAARLARGGDRAIGWVLVFVGSLTIVGHLAELALVPA